MPPASSNANVARSRVINPSCRGTWRRGTRPEKMDRVPAAVKRKPETANTTAGYPILFPGTRPNSETASALVNARMEAAARTCSMTTGRSAGLWRRATVMATNNRPVSAAAQSAIAGNRSR